LLKWLQVVSNFSYNYVHDNWGYHILEVSGFEKVRLPIYQTTSHNGFYKYVTTSSMSYSRLVIITDIWVYIVVSCCGSIKLFLIMDQSTQQFILWDCHTCHIISLCCTNGMFRTGNVHLQVLHLPIHLLRHCQLQMYTPLAHYGIKVLKLYW
jgi:hypothetical protein